MEGWSHDWVKMFETVAAGVEQFFLEATKEMTEALDAFAEFSEDVASELESAIAPELANLDAELDPWIESILQAFTGLEATLSEAAEPVTHTLEPMLNEHPACVGCRHYHGQMYGGNVLVCAMYPYGSETETCPDWESSWKD
ncbi:hypothetical protein H6F93_21815 [Leptolyngbya sp. FACHB-671]|uniref:hypothetical protein n=1 Tax=Leptolyngbya sp. FACHB-671 TaxID=2692812 RepID=UPI001688B0F0|nr:hypothetical protein [Leptolyngbya sp. FACHB-671]MBD2070120.1 hypothetical protein [Leptolyngbya sp. FACHB-671]